MKTLGGHTKDVAYGLGNGVDDVADATGKNADSVVNTVGRNVDAVVNTIGRDADAVADEIGNNLDVVVNTVGRKADKGVRTIGSYADKTVDKVGEKVNKVVNTVGYDIEQSADSVRRGVRTVGGDLNDGVKVIGSDVGQFLNGVGFFAQNSGNAVGSELNSVKTTGTNLGGVMNYLEDGVDNLNKSGSGSGTTTTMKPVPGSYLTTPYHTAGSTPGPITTPYQSKNIPTTPYVSSASQNQNPFNSNNILNSNNTNNTNNTQLNSVNQTINAQGPTQQFQFQAQNGANPAAVYKKTEVVTNYEEPTIRKNIQSPSGPIFIGKLGDKSQYGNAPGAIGGSQMDPYSYFGNIPSKGFQSDPQPFGF